jgi:hypothetical protein
MGVFANDDRRPCPGGEDRQHLPEEAFANITVMKLPADLETQRRSKVAHGAKRARSRERVTRGAQHRGSRGSAATELVDERRLPDPGFATNQDHAPVSGGGLSQVRVELGQVLFTLE